MISDSYIPFSKSSPLRVGLTFGSEYESILPYNHIPNNHTCVLITFDEVFQPIWSYWDWHVYTFIYFLHCSIIWNVIVVCIVVCGCVVHF